MGSDADDGSVITSCPEPATIDGMFELAGQQVADFSPADDESFAISMVTDGNPGYTNAPLGAAYNPTDVPHDTHTVSVSPDGTILYYYTKDLSAGMRVRRVTQNGSPAAWTAGDSIGMNDDYPGRPTADDTRIMGVGTGGIANEWEHTSGTFSMIRAYDAVTDFGNSAGATITSANLSPDGTYLLYTLDGADSGIHLRVRAGGSFAAADGATGRGLRSGQYSNAVLTKGCTHLFVFDRSLSKPVRFDVHP